MWLGLSMHIHQTADSLPATLSSTNDHQCWSFQSMNLWAYFFVLTIFGGSFVSDGGDDLWVGLTIFNPHCQRHCAIQDNQKRFLMFNKAAVKALEVLPFGPGTQSVIVANDWHTAILPLLVKVRLTELPVVLS